MPTLVKELDRGSAYTLCPICRQQGNDKSQLQRDSVGAIKCLFGHGPFTGQALQQYSADMIKATEVFPEQPTLTDIKWGIFVNPNVKAKLEQKFAGRILVTIGTYLAALADDSIVLVTGEQATELRKMGIKSGADMLSLAKQSKETERERDDAIQQIEKFMQMLKTVGVTG